MIAINQKMREFQNMGADNMSKLKNIIGWMEFIGGLMCWIMLIALFICK